MIWDFLRVVMLFDQSFKVWSFLLPLKVNEASLGYRYWLRLIPLPLIFLVEWWICFNKIFFQIVSSILFAQFIFTKLVNFFILVTVRLARLDRVNSLWVFLVKNPFRIFCLNFLVELLFSFQLNILILKTPLRLLPIFVVFELVITHLNNAILSLLADGGFWVVWITCLFYSFLKTAFTFLLLDVSSRYFTLFRCTYSSDGVTHCFHALGHSSSYCWLHLTEEFEPFWNLEWAGNGSRIDLVFAWWIHFGKRFLH